MAVWLSRNDFTNSDKLYSSALNNLANDDRNWGGNVNGGGYTLSNVKLGNVNVGNSPSTAGIAAFLGTLAPTLGAGLIGLSLSALSNNYDELSTTVWRSAGGSQWDTAFWRVGRYVDSSLIAYTDYGVHRLAFGVDNGERVAITTTGMGIGIQNPDRALAVNGAISCAFDATGGGGAAHLYITGRTDTRKFLSLSFDTSLNIGRIEAGIFGVSFNPLAFNANGGNVGIGTTSALHQLTIVGTGVGTPAFNPAASLGGAISLDDSGVGAGYGGTLLFSAAGGAWRFAAIKACATNGAGNSQGDIVICHRKLPSDTTLSESVRFTAGGSVGIGKTPSGFLLDVAGAINATAFYQAGSPHLATLAAGPDDLPPAGGMNLWLDEDAGRIAVRFRNKVGAVKTAYLPIE